MWKLITEAWRYRYVTENFIVTNLSNRYKESAFGYLWSVLLPLARYSLMGFVFSAVLKINDVSHYKAMFLGMVVYSYISTVVVVGVKVFPTNANYIKKINIPKLTYVLNSVFYELANFLLVFVGIVLIGIFIGWIHITPFLFLSLVGIVITTGFLIGLVCILSVLMLYFHDTQYIADLTIQTVFLVTPIMYPVGSIPEYLYVYNPFYYAIQLVADPLLNDTWWSFSTLSIGAAISVVTLLVGLWLLDRNQDKIYFKV